MKNNNGDIQICGTKLYVYSNNEWVLITDENGKNDMNKIVNQAKLSVYLSFTWRMMTMFASIVFLMFAPLILFKMGHGILAMIILLSVHLPMMIGTFETWKESK